jgi:hypothetical protein
MKTTKFFSVVAFCALLFQAGCVTNLYVNFGNGTGQKISVKDTQTGREVQIAPGKFRKVSHDKADLIVTTFDKTRYQFSGIKVVDQAIDQMYYDHSTGIFGTWHIDINVLLQTNMDVYALLPGKKAVDASVTQPDGYPKLGKKMAE